MRISGFNSALFSYMNGGNNSFLNSVYGTGRTASMFGTKNANKYSNIMSYYEKMAYNGIKAGAAGLRTHSEALNETGEESLFGKAEATGNTKDVVNEINNFVEDYNAMLSNMKKTGGSIQTTYAGQFSTQALIHREELAKIGITAQKDGTLSVNEATLKAAGIDDMKKVFQGTSSFAGRVSMKSIYVESSAVSNLSGNMYGSYNRYGGYQNSFTYGAYSTNSFASLYNSLFNSYF